MGLYKLYKQMCEAVTLISFSRNCSQSENHERHRQQWETAHDNAVQLPSSVQLRMSWTYRCGGATEANSSEERTPITVERKAVVLHWSRTCQAFFLFFYYRYCSWEGKLSFLSERIFHPLHQHKQIHHVDKWRLPDEPWGGGASTGRGSAMWQQINWYFRYGDDTKPEIQSILNKIKLSSTTGGGPA